MKIYELKKDDPKRGRKKIFMENYNPNVDIDIKKTADSFNVSIQMVYRWIKECKEGK
jgi:transposase